jgi:hypothetical protein
MNIDLNTISSAGALGPDRADVGWVLASALDPSARAALVGLADHVVADAVAAVM